MCVLLEIWLNAMQGVFSSPSTGRHIGCGSSAYTGCSACVLVLIQPLSPPCDLATKVSVAARLVIPQHDQAYPRMHGVHGLLLTCRMTLCVVGKWLFTLICCMRVGVDSASLAPK